MLGGRQISLIVLLALIVVMPLGLSQNASAVPLDVVSDTELYSQEYAQSLDLRADIGIISEDGRGITLELSTPSFDLIEMFDTVDVCQHLSVEGYGTTSIPGAPALPVKGVLIGIPDSAAVQITVLESERVTLPGFYKLCPTPTFVFESDPDSLELGPLVRELHRDSQYYARNEFAPETSVEMASTGFIRSQRVAEIRFHPFQYNPVSGELRHLRRIRVHVEFDAPEQTSAARDVAEPIQEGGFEPVLQNLLNYERARAWRVTPIPTLEKHNVVDRSVTPPQYRIVIDESGLYKISYAALQAADPTVDLSEVDPRNIEVKNQGRPVAIWISGEDDGVFDPEDVIYFYGEALETVYTDKNVYWLTWDMFPGSRMATVDGAPDGTMPAPLAFSTTYRLEQDLTYQASHPSGVDRDRWYWNLIRKGVPGANPRVYTWNLYHIATKPATVTLRGLFKGRSATPEHSVVVSLNGNAVYTGTWPALQEHLFEVQVPTAYLQEGANSIQVLGGVSSTIDEFFVNWFELDYHARYAATNDSLFFSGDEAGIWEYRVTGFLTDTIKVFDVTSSLTPVRILNPVLELNGPSYTLVFRDEISERRHYYAVASTQYRDPLSIERVPAVNLRDVNNSADYIVITHANFYTAASQLADYRASSGLRTFVVDVEIVYNEFSYGIRHPDAIRDFLAFAYANWQSPAPMYVVFMGDGNYDPKNNFGFGETDFIPPYLADIDPWMGETAGDNRYVAIHGVDILPDMYLGRLPVRTPAEAEGVVAKIINYEQSPPAGDWTHKTLFVADNADSGGQFHIFSDMVADYYVPTPYAVQKVYYLFMEEYATVAATRAAILGAINQGRLMVNYVGHSAPPTWAAEGLLRRQDVSGLTNGGKLPFMVPMTCLEGYYIIPSPTLNQNLSTNYSSLGEAIVRRADGGAIASWSPTGQGLATGHDIMNKALYQAIFFNDITQLGPATTIGKLALINMGHDYLIDTYLLFGDPATQLNTLPADVSVSKTVTPSAPVEPGDWITYTLTYTNAGPARANNVVLQDLLPGMLLTPTFTFAGATITPRLGAPFTWNVAALPPNTGGMVTITARVSPDFSGIFTNTATISTSARETDTDNNASAPIVSTVIAADVTIEKHGPHSVWPGDTITYTLVYTNIGDVLASGVVITDLLPAPLLTPVVTFSGPTITPRPNTAFVWDVANLAPGASGVITITGLVSPTFEGDLTNRATISTLSPEPNQANNTATLYTGVLMADLALSKTGPVTATPGALVTYRLTYSNIGSGVAAGVVLTETLPDGLVEPITVTFTGAAITPRPDTAFVWDVVDLGIGAGGVVTITARVASDFSGVLLNRAEISTISPEVHLLNNVVTPVSTAVLLADLSVSKSGPAAVSAGDRITYTLVYSNMGDARATGVVITDTLPAALFDVSVTSVGAAITPRAGTAFVWDVASLPPGAGGVITITGQITPTFEGLLTNTAMISTETPEFVVDNNSDEVTTAVLMADLALTKSGAATAFPGERIAYVLRYHNEGTSVATGVILTDTLPVQLLNPVVLSSSAPITLREGSVFVWDVADLAPDAGGVITITATVPTTFRGELPNQALITTRSPENHIQNNVSSPVVTLVSAADVSIAKSGPTEALAGSWITYTLTYANIGDALAASVVITDLLPMQLQGASYAASNPAITLRPGTRFVWDVGALAPGVGGVLTITATVDAAYAGALTNTASIATSNFESDADHNSAQLVTQITRSYRVYLPLVVRQSP